MRRHIVVTGTGRSGTTFLVQLLTKLGLDTGFSPSELERAGPGHAGLEHDIRKDGCPFIVKSPWFCDYAEEVFAREDIVVERVIVPMRDLHAAAESRRHVTRTGLSQLSPVAKLRHKLRPKNFAGGLWHTRDPERQEEVLLGQLYKLMLALANTAVPVTFLQYPRLAQDCGYLFQKLNPIFSDALTLAAFSAVFQETVRPELIHSYGANDR